MNSFTTKLIDNVNETDKFGFNDSSTDITTFDNRKTPEPYGLLKYLEIYEKVNTVLTWSLIVLIAVALVGNILIIIVMTNKLKRKTQYSAIFVALAVSDLIVIVFGPFDRIFIIFTKYNLKISVAVQTFKTIVLYTSTQMSSWLLVFLTVERVLSVAVPFRVKYICGNRVKLILIISTFITLAAYNTIAHTVFLEIIIFPEGYIDAVEVYAGSFIAKRWIDACLLYFVPVFVLITGSTYIIYKRSFSPETFRNSASSATKILLSSVLLFIVTMTPFQVYTFLKDRLDSLYLNLTIYDALAFLIDLNSALNFYIYFLTGIQFRIHVRQTLRNCRCRLNSSATKHNSETQVVSSIQMP